MFVSETFYKNHNISKVIEDFWLWLTLSEHQYQAEIIIHLISYLIIILG